MTCAGIDAGRSEMFQHSDNIFRRHSPLANIAPGVGGFFFARRCGLIAEATHILGDCRQVRVIYVVVVNRDTMEPVREIELGKCLLAISVWVNEVRMIDNTLL